MRLIGFVHDGERHIGAMTERSFVTWDDDRYLRRLARGNQDQRRRDLPGQWRSSAPAPASKRQTHRTPRRHDHHGGGMKSLIHTGSAAAVERAPVLTGHMVTSCRRHVSML